MKETTKDEIKAEEKKFLGFEIENFFPTNDTTVAGYESIKVELLSASDYKNWVKGAAYASLVTWDQEPYNPVTHLLEGKFEDIEEKLLGILDERPISVALEGAKFTFKIVGIPRSMTHQIVRHRKMAFGQQSFRVSSCYADPVRLPQKLVELNNKKTMLTENGVSVPDLIHEFGQTVQKCKAIYKKMIEADVPMEQARNIMPMGTCTKIAVTTDLRSMIEYVQGRTSDIAQDEHTYIVMLMLQELHIKARKFYDIIEKRNPKVRQMMFDYLTKR